jgi:N-methylhydantoinase B
MEGDGQSEYAIPICATITVDKAKMTVDFTGSAPQVVGNANAVEAIVKSAVWYCVRLLAEDDIPMNHGCFQPITVTTPVGSFLNPHFPAAVAASTTETSQRVVDTVLGALAQALPNHIPAASQGSMNNVTFGGILNNQAFVYYETIAGGHGAGPKGDGLSGRQSHMTNTRNTPVEALEYALPVRILAYNLRENSGGQGHFHGGNGICRIYEFLAPATVTINSERRINTPYGLQDGESGQRGVNRLIRNGQETILSGKVTFQAQAGDQLIIETPGGGGWGVRNELATNSQ